MKPVTAAVNHLAARVCGICGCDKRILCSKCREGRCKECGTKK